MNFCQLVFEEEDVTVMAVCARCAGSRSGDSLPSGISSSPLSVEAMIAVWLSESRFKLSLKSRCGKRVVIGRRWGCVVHSVLLERLRREFDCCY